MKIDEGQNKVVKKRKDTYSWALDKTISTAWATSSCPSRKEVKWQLAERAKGVTVRSRSAIV